MEIASVNRHGRARVVNPTFEIDGKPLPILLDQSVINFLEQHQLLSVDKLKNLDLLIAFPQEFWEITEKPPVGTPGTIASIIFAQRGSLLIEDGICTLFI
jgi:hypothetical protein